MRRVILPPTDLFQFDSKDCLHLVLVRCQIAQHNYLYFCVSKKKLLFTVITKICNHSNVYVRRSLVAWTCVRSKAHATKGLSGFCTSFKTTGLLFFIPGNDDSRERCVPLGIVLSDCNPRSGSSGRHSLREKYH